MTAKTHFIVDRLDDGFLITVTDKDGERDAAAESNLAVIDRMLCWLGFGTSVTLAINEAVRKVLGDKHIECFKADVAASVFDKNANP